MKMLFLENPKIKTNVDNKYLEVEKDKHNFQICIFLYRI